MNIKKPLIKAGKLPLSFIVEIGKDIIETIVISILWGLCKLLFSAVLSLFR